MDPSETRRADKSSSHVNGLDDTHTRSSSEGWSGPDWSNTRPSLPSGDDQPPPPHQAGMSTIPGISQRRATIVRPSLHTAGSDIALDALNTNSNPYHHNSVLPTLDINTSSTSRFSPSPLSNGYSNSQAGPSYARSRRRETEVEVDSQDEHEDEGHFGMGKIKHKKKSRGSSFSLPVHRSKRRLSTSLPWPARWWPGGGGGGVRRPTSTIRLILVILLLLGSLLWGISIWRRTYEIQVEFSLFSKKWIKSEIDSISTLKGCFNNPSPYYNMTKHLSPKRNMLNPGISLKRGMSCYDFSSTIQPDPLAEESREKLIYHTYWRSDLIEFGERQIVTFQSFLATQPLQYSKLILWTNGKSVLEKNQVIEPLLKKWGEYIEIRQVEMNHLTRGTDLERILSNGPNGGNVFDGKGWVDGDAIRLLVLWHFGGIWLDMDQILTRDLHPLIEEEWVTQWDCYDKPYYSLNGALMHFERHSPYLCEAFHLMSTSPFPKPNSFTWGSHLYSKLHRALLAAHIRPFDVLPWCFADPRNCRTDNRFPDPFLPDPPVFAGKKWHDEGGREELEERVGQVWALHLHNQWLKGFPTDGWVHRLVEGYEGQLERLEIYARSRGLIDGDGRIRLEDGEE
ncbi:hypothetical protein I302_102403 [Kwoniella bestiolae CBS 10118]|uniref:Glycosyltransferase family 32 protein n=1 Tax=Kwoniella bestiolae CBS 10118 TaxID=1296100 RepID=A0A1B9GF21_9TREE|nr:hypothetical protein I302_01094 [Kwoniella bestiolae CBS 10118]OCF29586.1 hypothetical protein I302_01094 [Kwoniella bestiolae CBS 10118]